MALLALAYWAAAQLAPAARFVESEVGVWPSAGVALGALMLFGRRLWPGVVAGSLLVDLPGDLPLAAVLTEAVGHGLGALLGATMLAGVGRLRPSFDRIRDVVVLVALGGATAAVVTATGEVLGLRLTEVITSGETLHAWRVAWTGDVLGVVAVTPLVLTGGRRATVVASRARQLEALGVMAAVAAVTAGVFNNEFSLAYLVFPFLVWSAVRFSLRGAASATVIIGLIATVQTAQGRGPFAQSSSESVWALALFQGVVAVTGLLIAVVVGQRDRGQRALRDANRTLDARVRERTAQLDRDRQTLAAAQRLAHIGSWEWDATDDAAMWSDELYRLHGLDPSGPPVTRARFLGLLHPEDRAAVEEALRGAQLAGKPFRLDYRVVVGDDVHRWLHAEAEVAVDDDGRVRVTGTAQDITERRQADRRFESLLEAAPDAIVVVDSLGTIRLVNRQTERMFGYSRSELLGRSLEVLMPSRLAEHHVRLRQMYFEEPRARPMGAGLELAACRRDGSEFPVDIALSPLEAEEGTLVSASIRDITERKKVEAVVAHQALHDSLTGLPNRALAEDRLGQALVRARRAGTTVGVLFLDVDRFKKINDTLGHAVGDDVLRTVAGRLRATVRANDTVARFGGDEFVVVTELPAGETLETMSRRIADVLDAPVELAGADTVITVSVGGAIAAADDTVQALLRDADAAMYRAKEQGRDRFVLFDAAMRAGANARLDTEKALRRAIHHGGLVVHYQPMVDLISGRLVAVEALVRWPQPDGSLLLPAEFVPVAEDAGLVVPLGAAVLRQACAQVATWRREVPELAALTVSVNLSPRQLEVTGLPQAVHEVLGATGLDPVHLSLEITESVLLSDAEACTRGLRALKALGVRLAVDDFGTGYSSLTYLKRFPVDSLKIDRSFVVGLDRGLGTRGDRAIVAGIVDLAHAFGLRTVAEGVETAGHLAQLLDLGCELGQGWYWSPALAPADLEAWARSSRPTGAEPLPPAPGEAARAVRTLVVEDDRSLRRLERMALDTHEDFEVVAEAADGRQAIALARHHQPDLVLLDLAMPGLGGLEALPLIRSVAPGAKVVIVSGMEPGDIGEHGGLQGATGFIRKGQDIDHLAEDLRRILLREARRERPRAGMALPGSAPGT